MSEVKNVRKNVPTKVFLQKVVEFNRRGLNNKEAAEAMDMDYQSFIQKLNGARRKIREDKNIPEDKKNQFLAKLELERAPGGGAPRVDMSELADLILGETETPNEGVEVTL